MTLIRIIYFYLRKESIYFMFFFLKEANSGVEYF